MCRLLRASTVRLQINAHSQNPTDDDAGEGIKHETIRRICTSPSFFSAQLQTRHCVPSTQRITVSEMQKGLTGFVMIIANTTATNIKGHTTCNNDIHFVAMNIEAAPHSAYDLTYSKVRICRLITPMLQPQIIMKKPPR